MDTNYHAHQTPQFRVLSDRQIEKLILATYEVLDRTGVEIRNAEARQLLTAAGARVDGTRVRIPASIIKDAIGATPPSFTLWGRDGKPKIQVAVDRVNYGPGPTCTYFIDPETGERRLTRRGDPGLTALVCDALDNIDYVMSLGLISDVHHRLASVYEFAEMIANTTKPVLPWAFEPNHVSDIFEMAVAVAGSEKALREKPFLAIFTTNQAPLVQTDEDLANAFRAVELGLPVVQVGGGCAGSTSPITGAGTMVIYLAGVLSALAAIQLKRRGAKVCIGGVPEPMDLATGGPAYGGPEMSLYSAAMADIARYLNIPMMGTAGVTESKKVDLQAAIESSFQVLLSGLSGTTLVHDVGFLDCANIGSLEMLIMNDEIMAMTRRVLRGMDVSDESLMLDLIDRIGPGGEYMSAKETAKRCRHEIWTSSLFDRQPWEAWEAAGGRDTLDRINAKMKKILASHKPAPLPAGAAEKIAAILQAAETREAGA